MKNTLADLNNHLFSMLEKLDDDDLTGEDLDTEIKRAGAMADIGAQIIKTGELQLKAIKHMDEYGYDHKNEVPALLCGRSGI